MQTTQHAEAEAAHAAAHWRKAVQVRVVRLPFGHPVGSEPAQDADARRALKHRPAATRMRDLRKNLQGQIQFEGAHSLSFGRPHIPLWILRQSPEKQAVPQQAPIHPRGQVHLPKLREELCQPLLPPRPPERQTRCCAIISYRQIIFLCLWLNLKKI